MNMHGLFLFERVERGVARAVRAAGPGPHRGYVQFSFGKYNTEADVDFAVDTLVGLYQKEEKLV